MPKRLAIIDGKSVFYRGYYAMPNLSTGDGTPTGGVYGFAALSLELMKKLKPDYVCVAWDKPKTNIRKRKELYEGYKAGRKPAPPDFYAQIPMLHELLEAFSWPLYELDDYEADDIMATLAKQAEAQGIETCLITSDLDLLQAVGPLTHIYALKKGFSNIELYKPDSFTEKYGIRPDQFLDLKALKGDSSDNIPGVPGVGEKTGIQLLQQYETLDGVYENLWEVKDSTRRKLEAGKDSAYLSKKIAELWCDAPLELDLGAMDVKDLDKVALKAMLSKLEFRSLLRSLPDYMRTNEPVTSDGETELRAIAPATLVELDKKSQALVLKASSVVVWQKEDDLYLLVGEDTAVKASLSDASSLLSGKEIVTHGAKAFLKMLLREYEVRSTEYEGLPVVAHDTEHAAFLLDPLRKSRELGDLVGADVSDPLIAVVAVRELWQEQVKKLDELPKLKQVATTMDFPLIPVLARMEVRGIRLDVKQMAAMNKELTRDIAAIQKEMYELVGYEFNISSPSQLGEVLFTKLQLPTLGIKKGKTGYSTGQKELDKLRGLHPIVELIEKYRELTKLQNTYVEALPKLVDKQLRLHTDFRQDVAATGRLSSSDPNLQNIPVRSEAGRRIREAFVPDKGNVFVSADYSQFELRLAAVLAGDKDMVETFNQDVDIHAKTAAEVHGIPIEQVTKAQRRDAKVVNFGVLYGMGPHALAQNTGMSFAQAKAFIDEYFRLRSPIRKYIDATIAKAKNDGYVETYYGRRRPTPDVKSSNYIVRASGERAAANMPIQGTEADLMKKAMLKVEHTFEQEYGVWSMAYGRPIQVLQIHDSILVECAEKDAETVGRLLKETMESIAPELPIKLKVDVSVGKNWGEV